MAILAAILIVLASMAMPLVAQTASDSESIAAHARAAQEAEQRDDFKTAVREDEQLVKLLPGNAEVESNLGVALYFAGDKQKAIQVLRKAILLNPALFAPHLFSGLAWYSLSNPDAAVPELEKAVQLNGSDVIARTWLGYAYTDLGHYEAAIQEFQAVRQLNPDNIDALYALGQAYLEIGQQATRKLLAFAPDGGRAWQLAGEQFQLQGNHKQALEDFEQASQRRPDIAELHTVIARMGGTSTAAPVPRHGGNAREDELYRQAHDAEQKSRAAFERVVQIAPDSYRAHQIMAESYSAQQQYDQSNAEYEKVLALKPTLPGIHEAIGKNLLRQGKAPEALKQFQAQIQNEPDSAMAYMNAGNVLLLMHDENDAEKMLRRSLELNRPPSETYKLLAKIDLYRENYPSAIRLLTKYVAMSPGDSDGYYMLSRAYRATGNQAEMNRMLALYKQTSIDAKNRRKAEKELQPLDTSGRKPGETTNLAGKAAQ